MKVSIVIPVYNEVDTVEKAISAVRDAQLDLEKEIIVVDDGSTDGTRELLARLKAGHDFRMFLHERNRGKGASLRTGFKEATGDIVVIQDADLEYNPGDLAPLLAPIVDGKADVVYGSRFLGGPHRVLLFWHYAGNRFLTLLSNVLGNVNLTDMETGYKAFRRNILDGVSFKSNRFGFEPEFTMKVSKRKLRIYEVPISYSGRSYEEGKKITWKDGAAAVFLLLWYRVLD